jgi:hypothetical protein
MAHMAVAVVKPLLDVEKSFGVWLSDSSLHAKMIGAFMQKGGWEGWAQVEFGNFLTQNNKGWTVEREVGVYVNGGQRADLVCKSSDGGVAIVELKVETLFQSGTRLDDFVQRVEADIAKLDTVVPQFAASRKIAIGISIAQQTTFAAQEHWGRNITMINAHTDSTFNITAFYKAK